MAIVSFEIISVPVADQERAKQFYRDVLGFDQIQQQPWGRFTTFKDPDGNGWILRQPP